MILVMMVVVVVVMVEWRRGRRVGFEEWEGLGRGGFHDVEITYIDDDDCATICGDYVGGIGERWLS